MHRNRLFPICALSLPLLFTGCTGEGSSSEEEQGPFDLPAEAIIHHVVGEANGDWFGYSVCGLGDVNADGVPDFAVGAHQNQNWGARPAPDAPPGYINVYSGKDGTLLNKLLSAGSKNIDGSDDHLGFSMTTIQDQDGDGAREIMAGAYLFDADDGIEETVDENTGGVFIFSGRTGKILATMGGVLWGDRFGYTLSSFEDLNGDGREDLLIGVEKSDGNNENEGSLQVFAAASYDKLLTATGPGHESHLGSSVSRIGDVDGDGTPDLAGGAFMYSTGEETGKGKGAGMGEQDGRQSGWAGLYSGRDGALLRSWVGETMDHLGYAITSLGDVNADGVSDLAVGANQSGWVGDYHGEGYVRVYSCRDGALLYELRGEELGDQFSWGMATASDHDQDGLADLLVGAPSAISVNKETMTNRSGTVFLFSGADGTRIGACRGLKENDQFGTSVADVGDLDGDGIGDILVGAPENVIGQTRPGYALVISGAFLMHGRVE